MLALPDSTSPLPRNVVPTKKFTLPELAPGTVADSVTDAPAFALVGEALTVIEDAAAVLMMTWLTAAEVAVPLLESPPYCTVRLSVPTGRLLTLSVARPLTNVAVPSEVEPLKKVTVPLGRLLAPLVT